MLQRKRIFIFIYIGACGTITDFRKIVIVLLYGNPFSEIKLSHLAVSHHLHQIADLIIVQMKFLCFFIKNNTHYLYFLSVFS